jgi:hypothetical protein
MLAQGNTGRASSALMIVARSGAARFVAAAQAPELALFERQHDVGLVERRRSAAARSPMEKQLWRPRRSVRPLDSDHLSIARRPASVIVMRTTSTVLPPIFTGSPIIAMASPS